MNGFGKYDESPAFHRFSLSPGGSGGARLLRKLTRSVTLYDWQLPARRAVDRIHAEPRRELALSYDKAACFYRICLAGAWTGVIPRATSPDWTRTIGQQVSGRCFFVLAAISRIALQTTHGARQELTH